MALGLISSETLDDYWSQNVRRRIFHDYPNGTAPLTGLLSLMDHEETPHPETGWQEKRYASIKTQTKAGPATTGNKTGPFATSGSTTASGNSDGIFSLAAGDAIRVYVDSAADFRVNTVVRIFNLGTAASGTTATGRTDLTMRIATKGDDWIDGTAVEAATNVLNGATPAIDAYVYAIGTAFAEGTGTGSGGRIKMPYEVSNYTQIFKTPFELTRTALKEPTKYDKTGAYREALKDNGIDHLAQLEYAAFYGVRRKEVTTDDDGNTVPRRFMGGLLWFLQQWEKGSVAAGGAFDYGQVDVSAETDWMTYTNKRIIRLAGSTIARSQFNEINSRVFEKTNSKDWSKLCLCGPGYLNKIADCYERQIQFTSLRENGFKGFDFELVKHTTNAGTVYYKQHPLFNDTFMRNSAFYIDLGHLIYSPLTDSDTEIQPMVQLPGADKRKDMWLTEATIEFAFPEAHMFVDNLGGITL